MTQRKTLIFYFFINCKFCTELLVFSVFSLRFFAILVFAQSWFRKNCRYQLRHIFWRFQAKTHKQQSRQNNVGKFLLSSLLVYFWSNLRLAFLVFVRQVSSKNYLKILVCAETYFTSYFSGRCVLFSTLKCLNSQSVSFSEFSRCVINLYLNWHGEQCQNWVFQCQSELASPGLATM